MSELEQAATAEAAEDCWDDGDIIALQMMVIEELQQRVDVVEEENVRLRALNREQTASRLDLVRDRGAELKARGEILLKIAHAASQGDFSQIADSRQ